MACVEFHHKELRTDYDRWSARLSNFEDQIVDCKIRSSDVLRAHYTIVDFFLEDKSDERGVGGIGLRDINLLESAVGRQFVCFSNNTKWCDDYHRAATLTYGLVKDHPFHDCNKRTALLSCLYYLDLINRTPKVKQKEYEQLMILIANNELESLQNTYRIKGNEDFEVRIIAEFLRKSTRKSDKRQYEITFNELVAILNRFSYGLENPNGNYIDVVKYTKISRLFGLKKYTEVTKIATIGFPGWTKKVYQKDLKIVRKATRLTPERGYDSNVFFHGSDPMKVLVADYSGPLRRLADK